MDKKKLEKNKGGRPTKLTKELAEQIFAYMAQGYSLRQIEKQPGMPHKSTIIEWSVKIDHWFPEQYQRAMELRAEHYFDETLDIADDGSNDWMIRESKNGTEYETFNNEHFQRSKLRIETRKWHLSKLMPKKYGDKIQQEITGKNGEAIVPVINLVMPQKTNNEDE